MQMTLTKKDLSHALSLLLQEKLGRTYEVREDQVRVDEFDLGGSRRIESFDIKINLD